MPNWKKVIVSGSDANLRNITASGDISASGLLHASLSFDTTPVTDGVVVYDTAGGRFYYTGSYGGGSGGGTIIVKEDGVTTVAAATTIDFLNSTVTESPSGEANVGFDLQGVTDSGAVTTNGSLFLHQQNAEYGFSTSQLAKSGFAIDNSKAYTYATPQRTQNDVYLLGMHITDTGVGPYPNNFITINKELVYYGGSGPYDGGGGGGGGDTNPDTDHPDDLGGNLVATGRGIQLLASSSISSVTKDNKARGMYITPSALYMFNTDASASVSGTLIPESASAQIRFNTASNSIQFLAGSTNETLKEVLFVSRSGDNPKIGIGTTTPKAAFDIKDVEDSTIGTRFLLKSSRTTTGAQVGDSAGTINFAIDSASFNDIFSSGSVAAIDSKVISIEDTSGGVPNVAGNIVLKSSPEYIESLIEVAEIGHFHFDNLDPTEDSEPGILVKGQLTVGSGSVWQSQAGDVAFSVHNVEKANVGVNHLKFRITGSNAVIHSGSLTIGSGSLFIGETYSGTNQVEFLNLRGGGPIKLGHISGGGGNHPLEIYTANTLAAKFDNSQNLGIGTSANTAPEKLTVEGNISSSGEVIANSGNFTSLTGSNLQILGTASIAYFETLYTTASVIYSSGSTKFGDTMDDQHDFTGSVNVSGSTDIEGNLSVSGGTIDLKNSGAASKILLYCESNNAHAQTIQGAPHSDAASNTLVLPSTGTKFATQDGTETFTNKTLTSPDINTPDIDGGTIDNTVIGNSTANAGTFTSLTATNITASGDITASLNSKLHISSASFGGASFLRSFNVKGSGLDGRLSLQGVAGSDNPGIEFTVNDNTSRALIRLDQKGTNGTALEFFTEPDGGDIANTFTIGHTGHITASGDISASGTIVGSNLSGTNTGDQDLSSYAQTTNVVANSATASFAITGSNVLFGNITGSNISASGDITSNTFETISTTLASDSATNVDTFNSSSYNGAIYDYILKDTGVGARAGQFMVAHDSGLITFTDNSTRHLSDATAPEISAQINGANVEVQVTNGNGYTFKSFVKKL